MNKKKQTPLSPENYLRTRVRNIPIVVCYINHGWRDMGFAMIIVAREHINGNITHAAYMVDLYCLGLKDSFWMFNQHPLDFKEHMDRQRKGNDDGFRFITINYPLAHNIIYGAIEYAEELGFRPHKSFELTRYILEEDDEHVKLIDVGFGFKGKPLYVSSPENPHEKSRILDHLTKKLGHDNFYFITEEEAGDFFESEDEKERKKIDYQDPEIKRTLINEFFSALEHSKNMSREDPEKVHQLLDYADTIFYEYITSREELDKAHETVKQLLEFEITQELFSDYLLFGDHMIHSNRQQVKREAELLYQKIVDQKLSQGLIEIEKSIEQYPDALVFHYLKLKFQDLNTGTRKSSKTIKIYADRYPDYVLFQYLYQTSFLLNQTDGVSQEISERMHLKNFYPGMTVFCREEVLLYIHFLTLKFGFSKDIAMVEAMFDYMEENHPDLLPDGMELTARIIKLTKVVEWCEKWVSNEPISKTR